VTAYVELLADGAGAPRPFDVRFEVLAENAAVPLVAQPAALVGADGPITVARAELRLAGLPAGSYQTRAVIRSGDQTVAEVVRHFFYTPRAAR
jgi:hypothetical protein